MALLFCWRSRRFAAAAECGFKAVEYLSPYEHAPETIAGAGTVRVWVSADPA